MGGPDRSAPTPSWGYAFWGSLGDCGAGDMMQYCLAQQEGTKDKLAKACGTLRPGVNCTKQGGHTCAPGHRNNSEAIAYWRSAAAAARKGGWLDRVFDYTCDGATPLPWHQCIVSECLAAASNLKFTGLTQTLGQP